MLDLFQRFGSFRRAVKVLPESGQYGIEMLNSSRAIGRGGGGLSLKPPKFEHICSSHNFSPLSSVQIFLIHFFFYVKHSRVREEGSQIMRVRPRNICDPASSNPRNSGMFHVKKIIISLHHSYALLQATNQFGHL